MEDRLHKLERTNRWMFLALVALVALQAWSVLSPASKQPAEVIMPQARAETLTTAESEDKRPKIIFTTSQSGATLYEYRLHKNGKYRMIHYGN